MMIPMDAKKLKLSEKRRAIYARNKKIMEQFKDFATCPKCERTYPHYMLGFAENPADPNSISKLIINRASPERLLEAMKKTPILCLNDLAKWRHEHGLE